MTTGRTDRIAISMHLVNVCLHWRAGVRLVISNELVLRIKNHHRGHAILAFELDRNVRPLIEANRPQLAPLPVVGPDGQRTVLDPYEPA